MMMFQFPLTQPGGQIQNVMWTLQQWGLLDAFLPFLLFFAIIFATLQKVAIFTTTGNKPDRKMNGTIAFVIAAMVVVPHITRSYPPQYDPIYIVLNLLPSAGLLLLTLFLTLVLIGMTATTQYQSIQRVVGFIFLLLLGTVIVTTIWPAFTPAWLNIDPNMAALIITLLLFGGVVWFISRDDTPPPAGSPPTGFLEWLKKMYGG